MDLFDYQREAVDHLVGNGDSYLGYEMGLGKSAIAITTAKRKGIKRLLVLCPAVGKLTWAKEFRRWWPEIKVTVINSWKDLVAMDGNGAFVLSYNMISLSGTSGFDYIASIKRKPPFEMTILDEAHFLKTAGTKRTKAVLTTLFPRLGWCLPMSGTPMPNHAGELFPILNALYPAVVTKRDGKKMNRFEFENFFCHKTSRWVGARQIEVIEGSKNLDVLRQRLKQHMMVKKKRDVLKSLPPMMFDTIPIAAPNAPEWRTDWKGLNEDEFLAAAAQFDEHLMAMRRQLGVSKIAGAVDVITNHLENCRRKVLVFAHHTDVVDGLMAGLAQFSPVKIDGRDVMKVREVSIHRFLTDPACRVFIGNIKAAGTTITLVGPGMEVSDVFFVEADFSPGNNVQAASRIHRIGQHSGVQVWFLSAYGTYDDRVQEILARKAADIQQIMG